MSYSSDQQNTQRAELNNEQIQQLLNKLSSDEQRELADTMKTCTTEVTTTRGLPITAAILGSLYVARQRLPAQYHFGPKGWPFYAIMGIASLTSVNLLFMGMCRDRVQPRIQQLWNKYQLGASSTTYEEIRRQNRAGHEQNEQIVKKPTPYEYNVPQQQQQQRYENVQNQTDLGFTTYDPYAVPAGGAKNDFDMVSGYSSSPSSSQNQPRRPLPSSYFDNDTPSYMSGTPSFSSSSSQNQNRREFS